MTLLLCPRCNKELVTSKLDITEIHPYDIIVTCPRCNEKIAIGFNIHGLRLKES